MTFCRIIDFRHVPTGSPSRRPSPLNPLSAALRCYLMEQIQAAVQDSTVTCLVLTGGPHHFSAGADLTEFAAFGSDVLNKNNNNKIPSLIDVVRCIENCPKPVVAAIAGTCLGGGLEVALSCHYRVCTPNAKCGLPEVHVGVIPGAGGTQRLPRLIGLAAATQYILTGATIPAQKALKLRLVDAIAKVPDELLKKAQEWATWAEVMPPRRLGQTAVREHPAMAHGILHVAELNLPNNDGSLGLKAALRALRASQLPLEQGMAVESEAFIETLLSRPGQARRHNFFAVRQAQKPYSTTAALEKTHPLLQKEVDHVSTAVIGAGTMGGGIALVLLQAGFRVTLVDINSDLLQRGVAKMEANIQALVVRQKLSQKAAKQMLTRLQSTTKLEDLTDCQLVVEAVVESLPVKRKIFTTLNKVTPTSSLLLSNTSTLSIDAMAAVLDPERRTRFMGWHFFSPAHLMKLVEIVVGQETSPSSVLLLQSLTKRIGKTGVVVGNCDGFCGNRMLKPYSAEMVMLLVEGVATIAAVDRAIAQDFGMSMGPFAMADLAGNDVGYNIRKERGWVRSSPSEPIPPNRPARYTELGDVMIEKYGRLGQKSGKGWYDYDPTIGKGRTPLPSKEVEAVIQEFVAKRESGVVRPTVPTTLASEQIIERILFPLVNEGFKCLEEGIVQRPSDIDVVYVYGYGWPVWRGGPMNWADHEVGLPHLLRTLQRMSRQFPETDHYQPSKLLEECVRLNCTVEEYYHKKGPRSKL